MTRFALLAGSALALAVAGPVLAADTPTAGISGLGIRNIGSAEMSGRIAAIAARAEDDGKLTIFVGAASGGVWKSEDGGTSFTPKFDRQPVQSIGAIALDPSNKRIVWVGTGESWTRNSVSVGNGIYKSTDGGDNWTLMGLPNVERITKIVVHPTNSDIVYACAPGALWSDSADRGLYKTTDGGKTWVQILKGANLSTGCSGVSLDPSNPDRILAGLWDFRRKGWSFRSGGDGPDAPSGSAMLVSNDGGKTWTNLDATSAKGLPKGPWGRIEVVHAPSKPERVYAVIEHAKTALYVSNDGGKTWEERDRSRNMVWRPFYFQKLVVDPTNADRLFKMNLRVIVSDNGGKSFTDTAGNSHADWHDVWVNPKNPSHLIGADDGGLWISYDGGSKWWHGMNLPISQFYHVAIDDKDPYQVYGGLQDNSSWVGDSEYPGGITNSRWENLYGGDGFWVLPDPASPDHVYAEYQGGNIAWINRKTLEQKAIQPKPGYKEKLRWNWNTPLALSPHDKSVLYMGSQYLHRTRDHGTTWERISPDLTTNNPLKQQQEKSGGITVDNSSAEMHTTIYSISESPKAAGTIWVGTDDGNVQVTTNGGTSWTNVTKALKLGPDNWVSWVEASVADANTAYVTVDRHMWGDFAPHVFVTRDGGKGFTRLAGPATAGVRGYAHVIKEDRVSPNILYLGTEFGLFISRDTGATWEEFRPGNFPAVAVRDIAQSKKGDDLVLATHGRGIWVIDDVSPLRALKAETLAANAVLIAGPPVEQRIQGNGGWSAGDAMYVGQNPSDGAVITYYQKARHVIGRMKLEIIGPDGNVVEELPTSKRKGLNRVVWSMRTKPPVVPPAASIAGNSIVGQRVLPGTYTVRLTKAGQVTDVPLTITTDARANFTLDDRKAQYDAAERVKALFRRMTGLTFGLVAMKAGAERAAADPAATPAAKKAALELAGKADALRKQVVATTEGGAITGEERLRENMDAAYGQIISTEGRPPAYAVARVDALEKELKEVEDAFAALKASKAAALNVELKAAGLAPISLAAVAVDLVPTGGQMTALGRGMIGGRYFGDFRQLAFPRKKR
ncbi:sialidase [Sandarakinorhabdus cyanobacteriorum]|uniref:Sialidase n=1 Tax=Sandarakinorhabdus cyanobacteriorum TaxID=1981098 RepID=A0A255Y4Y3_9SPHN|nr:sialidase [Sandarakinorhabdus cyanobacteriorum]OYQ24279.1 sialidase [Sandarakinorhabdus cyanobacteriorum]